MLCKIGYQSETHLKLKSHKILFVHNICLRCPIVLKFCTEYGSDTAVLCAKFQDDWIIDTAVMEEQDFVRFEFKMSFGWIAYNLQRPRPQRVYAICFIFRPSQLLYVPGKVRCIYIAVDIIILDCVIRARYYINSLSPGRFEWNFRLLIFSIILVINGWAIFVQLPPLDVTGLFWR